MLTHDVYSEPAVGVAQIRMRPLPSPNIDEYADMAGTHTVMLA